MNSSDDRKTTTLARGSTLCTVDLCDPDKPEFRSAILSMDLYCSSPEDAQKLATALSEGKFVLCSQNGLAFLVP